MLAMPGIARLEGFDDTALDEGFAWLMAQEPYDPDFPGYFGEVRWTGEPEFEPKRTYEDDAGYDLIVSEDTLIPPGQFVDVPCGISVELPERTWAMITGRSSTLRKRRLLVSTGIIDTGYRGPLFAGVQNLDVNPEADSQLVEKGERLAQLILFSNTTMRYPMMRVGQLGPSLRGTNGFGSTGA
jgi:dUTP pyrophosphatase